MITGKKMKNLNNRQQLFKLAAAAGILFLAGCSGKDKAKEPAFKINQNPFPSTYQPIPSHSVLITNATILDGIGGVFKDSAVLL